MLHGAGPDPSRSKSIQAVPTASVNRKVTASTPENASARSQAVFHADASNPAAIAQHSASKLINTDNTQSRQLTPPSKNGIVSTGITATHNVNARSPCATLLAITISVPRSRVRKSNPKVPSRRSRLMQSAVSQGARIQIAQN